MKECAGAVAVTLRATVARLGRERWLWVGDSVWSVLEASDGLSACVERISRAGPGRRSVCGLGQRHGTSDGDTAQIASRDS